MSNAQLIALGIVLLILELAMIAMIWWQDKDRPSKAVARSPLQQGRRATRNIKLL